MKKTRVAVPQKKLGILSTILVNTGAALIVQTVFAATLLVLCKQIFGAKGLTSGSYHNLVVTAMLVDCVTTALAIVVTERLMEKFFLRDPSDLLGPEMNRAMYFGVVGILAVGIARAFVEDRVEVVWGLIILCGILLLFGGYHKKFREVRRGIWFPHSVFHFSLQQFVLFPVGLWVVSHLIK